MAVNTISPEIYRRKWPEREIAAPWPAPEVPARLATDAEIPTGARRMAAAARAAGWAVVATYARGTYPSRPPKVIDSLALRMGHEWAWAIAIWHGSRFHTAITVDSQGIRRCNATTLRKKLDLPIHVCGAGPQGHPTTPTELAP